MPRFVLEIGTEELPPRFFPVVLPQLREHGAQMLERARLAFREPPTVYGTPRRLAFIAEDLAERQAARPPEEREQRGPAARVAFDEAGKPTKAAIGFAKRFGLSPDALVVKETDQGEYVFAVVQEPELPAKEALAALLPALITGLSFPKSMRWGTGKLRFGRPIRWLLALVDAEVVEFELEGVKSGRLTRGHPVLAEGMPDVRGQGMFEVADAGNYEGALRDRHVIVDPDERLSKLNQQLDKIASDNQAAVLARKRWFSDPIADLIRRPEAEALLAMDMASSLTVETVFLAEYPTAAVGEFGESFVDLPDEVLEAEMRHVQSYFPMARETHDERQPWKVLSRFVAVRDGGKERLDSLIAGWESVLRAKLTDAKYFYEQDLGTPLADRIESLKGVVFQERLGTMYDKVERVRAVASALADDLALTKPRRDWLDRAAFLCKADLVTEMVAELPDLQGRMGAIYAEQKDKEPEEVWKAIRDHYRPQSAKDDAPDTTIGIFLAISDKLDTITSCFALGLVPTGSADPLGLRREGTGVVKCFAEGRFEPEIAWPLSEVSTSRLARVALAKLHEQVEVNRPEDDVALKVSDFLAQRLLSNLRENGVRYDLAEAALAVGSDKIRDAAKRAGALNAASERRPGDFVKTVTAATRPINISKGHAGGEVNVDLFEDDAERALWAEYCRVKAEADALRGGRGSYDELRYYHEVLALLGQLVQTIDRFFDDVLVMHEDEKIRRNRLALCWQLSQLFRRIADFTLIVQA